MQAPRSQGQTASIKIYNAVYSSVQVYECMVRGIAVMRRRSDSFVNATQILKVAGIDKGRRTKILEKDILPGKHEIVQGGYGKYQGTWIPLERGRELASQYGVTPQLAPLFDFVPAANSFAALPAVPPGTSSPRPLSAGAPPILPGSAMRLLAQGRAQGLFTPSTSGLSGRPTTGSPVPYPPSPYSHTPPPPPPFQQQPPNLKRQRSEPEGNVPMAAEVIPEDIEMVDGSSIPTDMPSPTKRPRTFSEVEQAPIAPQPRVAEPPPLPTQTVRLSTRPNLPRHYDPSAAAKDSRKIALIQLIYDKEDINGVLDGLKQLAIEQSPEGPPEEHVPDLPEVDAILDQHGHTALHIASSMGRVNLCAALLAAGADMHRGNYSGETPLIRACISTPPFTHLNFQTLLETFSSTLLTIDTSKRSVLHHICSFAGVKGRAPASRYYLDQVFKWIAQNRAEAGFAYGGLLDLQDEHGDTALNIAARVGNRGLVKTLIETGANKTLPNKLGLRPGDFGVETEELNVGSRVDDIMSSLRTGPPIPVQKSQDVIADMTTMIQTLSTDFQAELKAKQDALDVNQRHLRAATRELSEQRKQMTTWQKKCGELDQVMQRVKNIERALEEEDDFDWTGTSSSLNASSSSSSLEKQRGGMNGSAIPPRGDGAGPSRMSLGGTNGLADLEGAMSNLDVDPPIPQGDDLATLIQLRKMKMWQDRMDELLQARLMNLKGSSAVKEFQFKKIVALCTGLHIDKVEENLESLVAALDSEKTIVDIGRVSGFMQKVREGAI